MVHLIPLHLREFSTMISSLYKSSSRPSYNLLMHTHKRKKPTFFYNTITKSIVNFKSPQFKGPFSQTPKLYDGIWIDQIQTFFQQFITTYLLIKSKYTLNSLIYNCSWNDFQDEWFFLLFLMITIQIYIRNFSECLNETLWMMWKLCIKFHY